MIYKMEENQHNSFVPIQEIGRNKLFDRIRKVCSGALSDGDSSFKLGTIEEDTACKYIKNLDTYYLHRSYSFSEGVEFDLTYHPLKHLGYKIGVASVTDMLAMNCIPDSLSLNLGIPNKISVSMLEEFLGGLTRLLKELNITYDSVDVTASRYNLVVATSVTGAVNKSNITFRTGTKEDDALCVTGDLGGAMAGLRVLLREKKYWSEQDSKTFQPDLSKYEYVVQQQLMPACRTDLIHSLKENDIIPHAMTSVREGLINDINKLMQQNEVGFYIYQSAVPIALPTRQVADEMNTDVDRYGLYGGEDYQLLFTLPEYQVEKFVDLFNDFVVIGKATPAKEGLCMQKADGDVFKFNSD